MSNLKVKEPAYSISKMVHMRPVAVSVANALEHLIANTLENQDR